MDANVDPVVGVAVAAGLIGLLGIPSYSSLVRRFGFKNAPYHPLDQLYEDEDGTATDDSQRLFTTLVPRTVALLAVLTGAAAAVVLAVLETVGAVPTEHTAESWLRVAAWALQLVPAAAVFLEPEARRRFTIGVYASIASFVNLAACAAATIPVKGYIQTHDAHTGLLLTQTVLALVACLSFVSIQRRPVVYSEGRPVDGERTTSLLGRLSYSWCTHLIEKSEVTKQLEYGDLPQLAKAMRSQNLADRFETSKQYGSLWKTIMWTFRWSLCWQWVLVTTKSVFMFVPQFAMLKILQILEAPNEPYTVGIWTWVCLLGFVMLFLAFLENWLFWVVWTELGIPMRNMLSTLVFQKSVRRKDVKGVARKKDPSYVAATEGELHVHPDANAAGQSTALPAGNAGEAKESDTGEDELDQKTRQTTINLVGVDSNRVAMFATYAYFYPGTFTQIFVSVVFLGLIIGIKSLLVGLACFSITIPLNIWASRTYSGLQTQLMDIRDKKLAVTNEALQGIRQIKFSALEGQWQEKIREYRNREIDTQWWCFYCDTFLIGCYICSPVLLSAGCLATYALLYGDLAPSVAFTTIAILSALEAALGVLPELTTDGIDAWISINRIQEYLDAPEIVNCIEPADRIVFEDASVAWPADDQSPDPDRFVLRNVNFSIPPKELTVISGKTGAGKSLLLASLLGEVDKVAGTIYAPKAPPRSERFDSKATKGNWIVDSAIAFVAQVPWIENATLRENILFGLPLDDGRYQKTLQACALAKDLDMLDDGDMTEIGHNGVNLSGGQRWRVSFARALYSRAGILVLDDVFSAVDAHVGRQLFEEALTGELAVGRTRVLVTHHVSLVLPKTRYAIHLADGTVQYAGFTEDLRRDGRLDVILEEAEDEDKSEEDSPDEEGLDANGADLTKVMSRRSQRSAVIDDGGKSGKQDVPKKFVEDEKREKGAIRAAVYKKYLSSSGGLWVWVLMMLCYATAQGFDVSRGWWVAVWTDSYKSEARHRHSFYHPASSVQQPTHLWGPQNETFAAQTAGEDTLFYLKIYLFLSLGSCIFGTLKYFSTFVAGIRASRVLFEDLCYTVLRTPLRWLDTVPVGRILNRFTADFNIIDSNLAHHLGFVTYKIGETAGITAVSFFISPSMIPLAVVLMAMAAYVAGRFIVAARSVKRLENTAKSPIFELFGSVLIGIATVRGYAASEEYVHRMWQRIDEHGRSYWNLWLMNRWMGIRLSLIGALFTFFVALVIAASSVPASLAGFALAFALNYSEAIIWVLRAYAALELDMTAAERVMEFSSLEIESQGGVAAPAAWPAQGKLEVEDLVCGYAPDLPPVLQGLTFTAESGQRVGVVGRTGAGKSSLTLALFRFLEARSGAVRIDGIDIASLTLQTLRSRLAIIPQDPVLFSGTVRSNLDPFDQHGDAELRDALERVHLVSPGATPPSATTGTATPADGSAAPASPTIGTATPADGSAASASPTIGGLDSNTNPFRSLRSRIAEGGLNLSQGQRQLLCLARAIVARPRLMVLDEATSAVDKETDALIQRSIRDEFAGSTLIVIAHRLSTIADFDRILVLGEGRVLEFGTPRELLEAGGVFKEMVGASGEAEALEEVILGEKEEGSA